MGLLLNRVLHPPRERFEVSALDPTCDPHWDRLAASHPDFTVFHSSAWMRVLSKTYGHKPLVLCWSSKGEPAAALPILEVASPLTGRRGVSLPFTDFCEPLFFGKCDPSIIFKDVRTLRRKAQLEALRDSRKADNRVSSPILIHLSRTFIGSSQPCGDPLRQTSRVRLGVRFARPSEAA